MLIRSQHNLLLSSLHCPRCVQQDLCTRRNMIFLTLSHPIRKLILEIKIHQNQIKNNMTNVLPICYSPQIPTCYSLLSCLHCPRRIHYVYLTQYDLSPWLFICLEYNYSTQCSPIYIQLDQMYHSILYFFVLLHLTTTPK